jgi:hypothetical protein
MLHTFHGRSTLPQRVCPGAPIAFYGQWQPTVGFADAASVRSSFSASQMTTTTLLPTHGSDVAG